MTETSPDTNPDTSPHTSLEAIAASGAPANAMAESAPSQPAEPQTAPPRSPEPPPSFVKLAMRNMVRKGRQSLLHFGLTAVGFIGFILLVAWFGRPTLPQ